MLVYKCFPDSVLAMAVKAVVLLVPVGQDFFFSINRCRSGGSELDIRGETVRYEMVLPPCRFCCASIFFPMFSSLLRPWRAPVFFRIDARHA